MADQQVQVGRLIRPHGVRGEVRLQWDAPELLSHFQAHPLTLQRDGKSVAIRILKFRVVHEGVLAHLEGLEQREEIAAWSGAWICAARELVPPPDDGEYYLFELTGLTVVNPQGERLGQVNALLEGDNSPLMEIETPQGARFVPAIPEFVEKLDRDRGQLILSVQPEVLDWEEETPEKDDDV